MFNCICTQKIKTPSNLSIDDWTIFHARLALGQVCQQTRLNTYLAKFYTLETSRSAHQTESSWLDISLQKSYSFPLPCNKPQIQYKQKCSSYSKEGKQGKETMKVSVGKSTTYLEFYGNKLTEENRHLAGKNFKEIIETWYISCQNNTWGGDSFD